MQEYVFVGQPGDPISIFGGEPELEIHRNCVYYPLESGNFWENPEWGIYNSEGKIIRAAGLSQNPGLLLTGQSLQKDINLDNIPISPRNTYFYVGYIIHHYGHFICSTMARLWALNRINLAEVPLLGHGAGDPHHWFSLSYVPTLFGAAGVTREDFAHFDRPTIIPELIVPNPAFVEKNLAYETFATSAKIWGDRLVKTQDLCNKIDVCYISKTKFGQSPHGLSNERYIVDELERHGVPIVYPEQMTIPEQVALFRRSRCVMGQIGSAFHTLIFSDDTANKRVIQINMSPGLYSTNHALIDKVLKIDSKYVYFNGVWKERSGTIPGFEIDDPREAARALLKLATAQ